MNVEIVMDKEGKFLGVYAERRLAIASVGLSYSKVLTSITLKERTAREMTAVVNLEGGGQAEVKIRSETVLEHVDHI